ncbi:MAG TPA: hypothetical protein DC034_08565 [Clostridium sp.]|jgi:hypothetical protein|uniref:Twitching motility protein PilT n=1 Tax=Clostridium lapidicellarium TaxID=3240931 RepID=A0ABV4DW01_9CLOT|nr:hypothetical protein [uncultured Clostridium sp.]NLU07940.1 hypothetical protein [Clostridiales bacterium]HBC96829.1 hypothetical protein [Clostridium sp.]
MIHVFCSERGSGKTKELINLANEKARIGRGHVVYVDDDRGPLYQLNREIRFIATSDFKLKKMETFYGFLCGILSGDYDIDTIFVDGLFNIIDGNLENMSHLFYDIEKLSEEYRVNFYISINEEREKIPEFIMKYVA